MTADKRPSGEDVERLRRNRILIDADPSIRWWRPATGDVAEAKLLATELVAENRAQSKAIRAEKAERKRAK